MGSVHTSYVFVSHHAGAFQGVSRVLASFRVSPVAESCLFASFTSLNSSRSLARRAAPSVTTGRCGRWGHRERRSTKEVSPTAYTLETATEMPCRGDPALNNASSASPS